MSKFAQKQRRHSHPGAEGDDGLPSVSGIGLPRTYRFEVSDYKGATYVRAHVRVKPASEDWFDAYIDVAPDEDVEQDCPDFWVDESYEVQIRFDTNGPAGWTAWQTLPSFTYVDPGWTMTNTLIEYWDDFGTDVIGWGTFPGAHWQHRQTTDEGAFGGWTSAAAPRLQVEFRIPPLSETDPTWFQLRFVDIDTGYFSGYKAGYVEPP